MISVVSVHGAPPILSGLRRPLRERLMSSDNPKKQHQGTPVSHPLSFIRSSRMPSKLVFTKASILRCITLSFSLSQTFFRPSNFNSDLKALAPETSQRLNGAGLWGGFYARKVDLAAGFES